MIPFPLFAMAGDALFTATSARTGASLTFRVIRPTNTGPAFVRVLTGPNNSDDFTFLGTIFPDDAFAYRHGAKSPISPTAPSAQAFAWIWKHRADPEAAGVKIRHAGRCCRCGRTLTTPESIDMGVGPECVKKM